MIRLPLFLLCFAAGYSVGWYRREDPWIKDLDRYMRLYVDRDPSGWKR
jgi:hypothetical protein